MVKDTSVLIAGGGPAGIATALSLVNRGIPCVIAEPEMPAYHKVGETIPPNAKPMLTRSGIGHLLADPAHLPCYGNTFIWGNNLPEETNFFGQTYQEGWHINRSFFEQQLRTLVLSKGIVWLQGQQVTQCEKRANGWEVTLSKAGGSQLLCCDFLVDATGRSCRIARLLKVPRTRMDTLTGISALLTTMDRIQPYHTYIEAVENGWWYAAPLSDKKLSLAFMTDADLMEKQMHRSEYFLEQAENTQLIGSLIRGKIQQQSLQTVLHPASTSYLEQRFGSSWLAVGDAAYAFDPLSSYGMVSALEGGYYAGHAIADALAGEADSLQTYDAIISQAFHIYLKMHARQYQSERRWEESLFWQRRGPAFKEGLGQFKAAFVQGFDVTS